LINTTLGIDHRVQDCDIVGRKAGPLAAALAQVGAVSGRHAELHFAAAEGWTIVDLGSTNGTTVNGEALTPGRPLALSNADSLILGRSVEFHVRLDLPSANRRPLGLGDRTIRTTAEPR
jgi:pSer/pThr/pTyr-binding forkhead associated (FHA) protein